MISTNLRFTLRFLWKNKFFSGLNIFGLTLGLAASIWLLLYLKSELTYDQHYTHHETVYRISGVFEAPGVKFNTAASSSELAPMLANEYPEIKAYTRFIQAQIPKIKIDNQVFTEQSIFYTDQSVFEVFAHNFLIGDPATALNSPGTAVITTSINRKLFGDESGINQIVNIDGQDFKITGVIEDLPKNTHFQYSVLLAGIRSRLLDMPDGKFTSEVLWNPDGFSYLRFVDGFEREAFLEKFAAFNEKYFMPFGNQIQGTHRVRLQNLASIHYDSELIDDDLAKGNPSNLIVFSAIGLAILLLACINYVNLATARAGLRAKEIGIRKVLGSDAGKLRLSLMLESMVQVSLALLFAIALIWAVIVKTPFQSWLGVNFEFTLFQQPDLLVGVIVLVLLTGLFSGLYPSIYLSGITPVKALKGTWVAGKKGNWLRQSLVLFQFVISIGVLTTTLLMKDQVSFLQNQNLGFKKDQVMVINIQDSVVRANAKVLKEALAQQPLIQAVSSSNFAPGINIGQMVFTVDKGGEMKQQEFKFIHAEANYLETLGIELVEGNFFRGDETRGNQYFVINEAAARLLEWENPVGKKLAFFHQTDPGQVIGVVKDFNFHSLHNPIQPLVFVFNPNPGSNLLISYLPNVEAQVIKSVESTWNEILPNYPFEYSFLNDRLRAQYAADQSQNQLISIMAVLCVIISLIGLSGLTAFNVNQKTKEIGIRKVLGAMTQQIVLLTFSGTLRLVILAAIIAGPITYLIIDRWLDNFAYRTPFNFGLLTLAIALAVTLTFVIVCAHVLQTARRNPTQTLRQE